MSACSFVWRMCASVFILYMPLMIFFILRSSLSYLFYDDNCMKVQYPQRYFLQDKR